MIRLTALTIFVTFLAMYAWRDWYKSLCGLILLMAVLEHPDMPKSMFGIQGLNPWNILLGVILIAWYASRKREGLKWDMPPHVNVLLVVYLMVILVAFGRMIGDQGPLAQWAALSDEEPASTFGLISDYLINPLKWVIPGLLLYDGCRSRERLVWGVAALLGVYFFLGVQVIKWMPLGEIGGGSELAARSSKILENEIGYHRVSLSMMLAGASWAIFAARPLFSSRFVLMTLMGASLLVLLAMALTGGRTGYGTWVAVGLVLCFFRWRKYLLLAPVVALAVVLILPAAVERLTQGFTAETQDVNTEIHGRGRLRTDEPDLYTITAGRLFAWPHIVDEIAEAPLFGHGRLAMKRTGLAEYLLTEFGESFPHPHNAYLQLLLDTGLVGAVPVLVLFFLMYRYSLSLFRDSRDPTFIAAGGVALSLVVALFVASIGSWTFYPIEDMVGLWCAMGLMMRVYVQRERVHASVGVRGEPPSAPALWPWSGGRARKPRYYLA